MMTASLLVLVALVGQSGEAASCVSGPRVGQRPGPYSFVLATGDNRGKSHCYICETADRPAVIVFARSLSPELGRLSAGLDTALAEYRKNDLRGWVTVLHPDETQLDADVVRWAKRHVLRTVPVGVFEDVDGPPSYRLHRDADVTVLLAVKQKVVVNRAFRAGELTEARVAELLREIPRITGPAKK
ncbi:MAG: hypothetical protein U0736_15510 [Gemmataceae bacterium]